MGSSFEFLCGKETEIQYIVLNGSSDDISHVEINDGNGYKIIPASKSGQNTSWIDLKKQTIHFIFCKVGTVSIDLKFSFKQGGFNEKKVNITTKAIKMVEPIIFVADPYKNSQFPNNGGYIFTKGVNGAFILKNNVHSAKNIYYEVSKDGKTDWIVYEAKEEFWNKITPGIPYYVRARVVDSANNEHFSKNLMVFWGDKNSICSMSYEKTFKKTNFSDDNNRLSLNNLKAFNTLCIKSNGKICSSIEIGKQKLNQGKIDTKVPQKTGTKNFNVSYSLKGVNFEGVQFAKFTFSDGQILVLPII